MQLPHRMAGCFGTILLAACFSPPATLGQSYVTPGNANNQNVPINADGNSINGNARVPLAGTVSGLLDNASLVLGNGNTRLTVTQNGGFAFAATIAVGTPYGIYVVTQPTAQQCVVAAGQGVAPGGGVNVTVSCNMMLRFSNGQAARTVVGQPDFVSYARNFNQTTAAANSASNPWGTSYTSTDSGTVYLPDSLNSRVLGYDTLPSTNGAPADFLAGQVDFAATSLGCSPTSFNYISSITTDHRGGLIMVDMANNRVVMYDREFTGNIPITGVIGQTTLNGNTAGCTSTTFNRPLSASTDGNILAVGDAGNNRVMLWATLPAANSTGAAATMVLGQPDMTTCNPANHVVGPHTLTNPQGVWTDGHTLAAVSVSENRVLFWHNLPMLLAGGTNGVAPDVVIGQPDFNSGAAGAGASGLSGPQYIISDGSQFIVADTNNNRVLVYSTLSPGNGQAANAVLGQPDFVSVGGGGGASGMHGPDGLGISGRSLVVAEGTNARFMIFDSL